MPTLYREYRPTRFSEIVGQPHVTQALRQAVLQDRIAHAYLFHGPRGTGKTTTARVLAKRLFCKQAEQAEPCATCARCRASQEGSNTDIVEIDAASHRGIDDIRALRESIGLRPSAGRYKVYIIDEVHMLTHEAFAALLKTLEEPPPYVVFILATTEFHKVPATIISRCQVYRFRRASDPELRERLQWLMGQEKRKVTKEALDFIIQRSDGCFRDAESLLSQVFTVHPDGEITLDALLGWLDLPPRQVIQQFLAALVRGESWPALAAADVLFQAGHDPEQILRESILEARNAAIDVARGGTSLPPILAQKEQARRLPEIVRALLLAIQDLAFVPQPHIAVQLVILTLCTKKGETPPPAAMATAAAGSVQVIDVTTVQKVWPEIIRKMREKNPVASTFLRAVMPLSIQGSMITLRAKYALHNNFFKKPEHAAQVQTILSELLGTPITLQCVLRENGGESDAQGDTLLETVKEVFGDKVHT